MEKVINFLGGKKNGSERTGVFDMPALLKHLVMAMLTFGSIAFTAGAYFASAKDIPARMESVERKQDRFEGKVDTMLAGQLAMQADIRELRACILDRGGRRGD